MADGPIAPRADIDVIQEHVDAVLRVLGTYGCRLRTGSLEIHLERGRVMKLIPSPHLRPGRRAEDLPIGTTKPEGQSAT